MTAVYINDVSAFLPNQPVGNDEIEDVLGKIQNISSKTRRIVLKNNQITKRYYAIDPETGALTHSNAQMTAEAVRGLRSGSDAEFDPRTIACLCCGTSTPDVLLPGHALMVLGELAIPECDAVTTAGICISGMTAFKYAWMNVALDLVPNAVATGSELASSFTRAKYMTPYFNEKETEGIEKQPLRAFDADFLRWMLSDGAGAALLSPQPNPEGISLKVEWIEHISFAGELDTCMYCGGVKQEDGGVTGWRESEKGTAEQEEPFMMSIRQDIRLLDRNIVDTMGRTLCRVVEKYGLKPEEIDWFLPHYSSAYFRPKFFEVMGEVGFEIPYEKWFTNLPEKGNTGSAAMYIILAELFHSGRLKPGEQLLCFIPESGRFSHCFMLLTVV